MALSEPALFAVQQEVVPEAKPAELVANIEAVLAEMEELADMEEAIEEALEEESAAALFTVRPHRSHTQTARRGATALLAPCLRPACALLAPCLRPASAHIHSL